ncbi:MFS transporter [Corynebacterium sp. zg254]|uniref:MHS family MFS transporter n=1 Tax=Corynebacterium zhongnanshanii TaxID=2768834 RepID=A0ABQ6VED4_9CORY|nr:MULTISPECIES: MFS transporter [Corynebacterium]KAB3522745.1 MHS family MFS transporter [Corynebacterium zhongnanshanii]MCR5914197.1 MFS transporter [Corynebacterium sp. zg254]
MSTDTHVNRQEERRVLGATLVGTTIEWYDFFIYAQAAGLVFASQFFTPAGSDNATLAQILSWASLGISFLFRPLGAVIAGHLGDRLGRKVMLAATLILMGAATFLIGLLPTYESIGVAAPILLVVLRVIQGFSAGGEWGGAALLAVEHAPANKRGRFGTYPQIGVPLGLSLATAVLLFMTLVVGIDAYKEWAWRVPFLFSIVLIFVGAIVRSRVAESPVFEEVRERAAEASAPVAVLLKNHFPLTLKAALIFAANNATGYILMTFMGSYATKKLEMDQAQVFCAVIVAAIAWTVFTLLSGSLSDRIGRTQTFTIGYILLVAAIFPAWLLVDAANIWLFATALLILTPGLALSYGPQSALYAELFPREIRYSGVSISYAIGAILGGAFAPMIAQMLLGRTGSTLSIGVYLVVLYAIALIALWFTPRDLHKRTL